MKRGLPAYIGIGSNQGDPYENTLKALGYLSILPQTILVDHSSLYWSDPLSPVPQNKFLNSVALLNTCLSPHILLRKLKSIEIDLGRIPAVRWGPRMIDLDILFFGQVVLHTEDLVIPHPRVHQRLFSLLPLKEITPDFRQPPLTKNIHEYIAPLEDTQRVVLGYKKVAGQHYTFNMEQPYEAA